MTPFTFRLALAGATALIAAPALAQIAPMPAAPEVREVVVTATPLGVAVDELTSNVDVLSREALDLLPPTGLGDVLNGLPGVRSSFFGPGASRPVIRGLAGPRVQVLTNGLGQIDASSLSPDHQVATDALEARRIEVIRGPATLAYGGSAIGGVVNIIDERVPETRTIGGVDGRVSGFGSSVDDGVGAAAQLKVGEGPWIVALDAIRRESGDYDIPAGRLSQRASEVLGIGRDGDETVPNSASELEEIGGGVSYVGGAGFLGASVKRTESEYGTVAEEDVSIQLEQTRVDVRGRLDGTFGPFAAAKLAAGYSEYEHTEFEGAEVGTIFLNEGVEARLELVQRERGGWTGVVGAQGLTRDFDAVGEEAFVQQTTIDEIGAFTLQRVDRDTYGYEGGLRVDRRTLDNIRFGEREFTNTSVSGGVFARPGEGVFLGLSLSRNERAPDESELFANGLHVATGQAEFGGAALGTEFDKETATSVEASLHYDNDRFDTDLHAFLVSYDGFIDLRPTGDLFDESVEACAGASGVADPDSLPCFTFQQTGAEFYGFEAEAGYAIYRQGGRTVRLEGAADYVHGETDLGPPARIPPYAVTARLGYADPRLDAKLEVRRVGKQDRTAAFELPTDAYTLVNAIASVKPFQQASLKGVTLFVEGRNLTDEEAREHASFLKDVAPLPGRNLRAGVAWRF